MTDDRVPAPRFLAEHAEAFRASGREPAVPRLAATVVLVRPAPDGFEVYVQRRAATMAFAPGMYAFPGGSVDPADYLSDAPSDVSSNDAPSGVSSNAGGAGDGDEPAMGLPSADARAVVRAAVRELHEEAGVRCRLDAVLPWARWLTPEFEPRRYDTFFFVAALPEGQTTSDDSGEADRTAWLSPREAVQLAMLPPTRHTLAELAELADVAAVLRAAVGRDVSVPVRPVIEVDEHGVWLRPVRNQAGGGPSQGPRSSKN